MKKYSGMSILLVSLLVLLWYGMQQQEANAASTGANQLSVGAITAAPGSSGSFSIDLTNTDAVASGEIRFTYNSTTGINITNVVAGSRASGFTVSRSFNTSNPAQTQVVILFFNLNNLTIPAGSGGVVDVQYTTAPSATGSSALDITTAVLSDSAANGLNVTVTDGSFTVATSTSTPTATPTATDTPAPPTSTATPTPTFTSTPEPPTPTATSTPTLTSTPTATATPDLSRGAVLAILPVSATVALGQPFSVTVQVHTIQKVDSAAAYIMFDPAYLQVASVVAGTGLPVVLQNQANNTLGSISFAAGALGEPFPTADFTLATVVFTATNPSASTALTLGAANPWLSDVTYGGNSILASREHGAVTVLETVLIGRAQPPNRPAPPHARWRIPVTVTLQSLNVGATVTDALTLDSAGYFTVTNQSPGAYLMGLSGHNTLRTTRAITLSGGTNTVDFGTLRGGDANGDNYVTILDFSTLVTTFGRCTADSGYDARADFNGDNCVTIHDFSTLSSNFGSSGDSVVATVGEEPVAPTARLYLRHQVQPLTTGDRFAVDVVVDTSGAPVDGSAAYLVFDPTIVQVVDITTGSLLPEVLHDEFDNTAGRIAVASGAFGVVNTEMFTLATITLQAVAAGTTSLVFEQSLPRQSDVTYAGASVLTAGENSQIIVTSGESVNSHLYLPSLQR